MLWRTGGGLAWPWRRVTPGAAEHTAAGRVNVQPIHIEEISLPSLLQRLEYLGYCAGTALLARAPEGPLYRGAAALGRRVFDLGGRRVRIAQVNLRIAFPEKSEAEREQLARESFVEFVWAGLDIARARRFGPDELRERVAFEGGEHIEKALAEGKGCLIAIPHLSSLELALRAAPAHGVPITVLTKAASNPLIDAALNAERERAGARVLPHRWKLRRVLQAIREQRPLVISNDQYERRRRSVWVPFFGVRAPTSRGLAALSLRTGAPVVPVYIVRNAGRLRLICLPAIAPARTGQQRRDVKQMTALYNRVTEGIIREHPGQYLWIHKRFRHTRDLPRDIYER